MQNIIKGDQVKVLAGKDRNKTGKVLRVLPKEDKVVVEGINIRKKHVRPRKQGEKGQTISIPAPLHVSNLAPLCTKCGRPTRVGFRFEESKKVRFCKKCKKVI